ncbi:MAG: excinuclease ABC subunit UvrC [Alphaproteobacteria bacterium]|nr:excinuclease ABC subunit UvrC [Alphaproteobacteria bacterium]
MTHLQRGEEIIRNHVRHMPDTPGIYIMLSTTGEILYIGKAKRLKRRVISYARGNALPLRLQRMVSQIHNINFTRTETETEALLLECNLIRKHRPRYNILLKDDKSYPYIYLTPHLFPKIIKHRGAKAKDGEYFGPYAHVEAVDEALLNIQKIFKIRNCPDHVFAHRKRPCLQYHIKRCTAPCVGKIDTADYAQSVQQAKKFLQGKTNQVQEYYQERMMAASDTLQFERAAQYRDQIKMMQHIQSNQRINIAGINNTDIIAFYEKHNMQVVQIVFFRYDRHFGTETIVLNQSKSDTPASCLEAFLTQFYITREPPENIVISHTPDNLHLIKKMLRTQWQKNINCEVPRNGYKLDIIQQAYINAESYIDKQNAANDNMNRILKSLSHLLDLEDTPKRIEVYDNSHIQGTHPVGCMIVVTPDGFDKKSYRKFDHAESIAQGGDDYAMMSSMLMRRLKHKDDWQRPDLIIVDGGLGQVSVVQKVMEECENIIPLMGISKGIDRNAGKEYIVLPNQKPFQIDFNSPILHFLQRIRDEAHRFAITTHRSKRTKNISKSKIDAIPGVGPKRKKALLQHFGSAKAIEQASMRDLALVKGMSDHLAKSIYAFFRN